MYVGYATLLKRCIKGTCSSQPMVCFPANNVTQVDELQQFALPDSCPLPINALLFDADPHALAAAQPAIAAHSDQLAPPPHDASLIGPRGLLPPSHTEAASRNSTCIRERCASCLAHQSQHFAILAERLF